MSNVIEREAVHPTGKTPLRLKLRDVVSILTSVGFLWLLWILWRPPVFLLMVWGAGGMIIGGIVWRQIRVLKRQVSNAAEREAARPTGKMREWIMKPHPVATIVFLASYLAMTWVLVGERISAAGSGGDEPSAFWLIVVGVALSVYGVANGVILWRHNRAQGQPTPSA